MAKAKAKVKPRTPKRVPFGGCAVCFKGPRGARKRWSRCSTAAQAAVRHDESVLGVREATPSRDEGVTPHACRGGERPDHQRLLAPPGGMARRSTDGCAELDAVDSLTPPLPEPVQ